jgi:multiple sugar transport system substrate-binding protein
MASVSPKTFATLVTCAVLFAAGLYKFGVPPLRGTSTSAGSAAIIADTGTTSSKKLDANRIIVSHNSGAFEDDIKRQKEQDDMNALFMKRFPDATRAHNTWQFSPDTFFAKHIAGTLTDVIGLFATEATLIVDRGMAADITDQLKAWKYYPHVNKKLLEPVTKNGRHYGLPIGEANGGFYVMTLFYNRDMFREAGLVDAAGEIVPPHTWDDFTTYAKHLTNRDRGVAGFGILGENGGNAWHFLNWAWQAGGDFQKKLPDGKWVSVFHEPGAVRALQFIKDLRWKHDVLQRNVLASNEETFQMFTSNRIAMAIFTPEYLTFLVDKYGMSAEKIGICLLPAGPAGRANQIGGSYVVLNPRLQGLHKQRAFDSAVFSYEPEVMEYQLKILHEQKRRIGIPAIPIFEPAVQKEIDAVVDKYRNLPDYSEIMQQAAQVVRLEPPYRCQAMYSLYLGPAIQEVLIDKNADPAELLKTASEKFQIRELDPLVE